MLRTSCAAGRWGWRCWITSSSVTRLAVMSASVNSSPPPVKSPRRRRRRGLRTASSSGSITSAAVQRWTSVTATCWRVDWCRASRLQITDRSLVLQTDSWERRFAGRNFNCRRLSPPRRWIARLTKPVNGRRTHWSISIVIRRRTSWSIACVWREGAQWVRDRWAESS